MAADAVATRRRFTRMEFARMAEGGVFGEHDRVELIQGEIVQVSPPGRHHRAFVNNLTWLLARRLPERAMVSVQNPLPLSDDTEPQPDLAVLRVRAVSFKDREAEASDAVLVIEALPPRTADDLLAACGDLAESVGSELGARCRVALLSGNGAVETSLDA